MPNRIHGALAVLLLPLLLAACQTTPPQAPDPATPRAQPGRASAAAAPALADSASRLDEPASSRSDPYRVFKGTGVMVKGQLPCGGVPPAPAVQQAGGAVVLNFEAADVREVIRNVVGEILGQSYTIDPEVGGQVTIRTT